MPLTGYANPSVAHHLTFVLFASVRVVQALFDLLLFFTCMFALWLLLLIQIV